MNHPMPLGRTCKTLFLPRSRGETDVFSRFKQAGNPFWVQADYSAYSITPAAERFPVLSVRSSWGN